MRGRSYGAGLSFLPASLRAIEPFRAGSAPRVRPFAAVRQRLLWPRLTSRSTGGLRSAVPASPVQAQGEISQGKARDFRSICPPHLRPLGPGGFRASGLVAPSPTSRSPLMRFVFLGPELCLRLPSRVSSRSYGCRSARGSQPPGPPGDSHPLVTSRSAFASRLPLRVPAETRHAWRTTERPPRPRDQGGLQ